ncbi:hypothetical protein I5H75_gp083 [Mycobacterium phage OwlsT2W]|uniref:Uncharacterized protein n=1 Tax=Mycobacterium phage OwlsT2W TaxID=2126954 RepID=A0A2R4AQE7_9CAUD|nr:hypothetical protein I5H75_gp083 [Mycobacterium phage OwlsT2W]AVR77271.1 hypothetical protein SEA_OWLST2W_83 [Mycobacterium phage OwlsT2W]
MTPDNEDEELDAARMRPPGLWRTTRKTVIPTIPTWIRTSPTSLTRPAGCRDGARA